MEGFKATDIMSRNPKSIDASELAVSAVRLMEKHQVTQLIVTNEGQYAGFVHMHDLMREGLL